MFPISASQLISSPPGPQQSTPSSTQPGSGLAIHPQRRASGILWLALFISPQFAWLQGCFCVDRWNVALSSVHLYSHIRAASADYQLLATDKRSESQYVIGWNIFNQRIFMLLVIDFQFISNAALLPYYFQMMPSSLSWSYWEPALNNWNKFALLWGEAQLCLPYVCL